MNEDKDISLISSFLEGSLSKEEVSLLESRLHNEAELRSLLQDMKVLRNGIRHAEREQLRHELKELEKRIAAGTGKINYITGLKIAAAVALVAIASWLLWPAQQRNTQELFAENFKPYPNIIMPTVRGGQKTDSTEKAQAFAAYDQQDYQKAIDLFEHLDTKDEGVLLYLGNSYLAANLPDKAIPVFQKLRDDFDVFDEQAEWYLAGCYIKLGKGEKGSEILKAIVDGDGSYSAKAERLLNTLNP